MTRPLRIQYENACYHVMNRGRGRQMVFHSAAYYEDYLRCLDEAHKRFGIEIHAYCLMGNHYHLLIKTPRGNLSRAMRHIDGLYTQRHNRRKQTDGSLFRGRYKAIVVDTGSYLLPLSRYIHRNPIETKTPMVKQLIDYPWSSYAAYINQASVPDWLNRDTVYAELGSYRKYSGYQTYVKQGNNEEIEQFYRLKHTPAMMGDKAFKESAQKKSKVFSSEIDKKGLKQPVALMGVISKVSAYYRLTPDHIQKTNRGQGMRNVPRWIAMKLCQEVGGAKLEEIADLFHVGHYSTVSQTIGRLNKLMAEDPQVQAVFNVLSQDLTP